MAIFKTKMLKRGRLLCSVRLKLIYMGKDRTVRSISCTQSEELITCIFSSESVEFTSVISLPDFLDLFLMI